MCDLSAIAIATAADTTVDADRVAALVQVRGAAAPLVLTPCRLLVLLVQLHAQHCHCFG